jgi:hypothetical protein
MRLPVRPFSQCAFPEGEGRRDLFSSVPVNPVSASTAKGAALGDLLSDGPLWDELRLP